MSDKKTNTTNATTIITDGGTVILNSVGNVHHGSGTQINISVPSSGDKKNKK